MSLVSIAAAVVKGIVTVGKFIAGIAPKAAAMVTAGLTKIGVSAKTAAGIGSMVKTGVALAEIKAIDKLTESTVAKVPVIGPAMKSTIDTIGIVGALRSHLK